MGEYAFLVGLVVTAAVAMNLYVQRAVRTGIGQVTNTVLGEPPAPEPDPDSESRASFTVDRTLTEDGSAGFRRTTRSEETIEGESENEIVRLRVIEEP